MTVQVLIKVSAGASRNAITGWLGDRLKISVNAPREKGRANKAVEKLIAKTLGVPGRDVSIVSGLTSTEKTVEIRCLGKDRVFARLPDRTASSKGFCPEPS